MALIEQVGWENWRNDKGNLKSVRDQLKDTATFDDFCYRLKMLLDDFKPQYEESLHGETEENKDKKEKKTDRQKEVGRDLESLHRALKTAKKDRLFARRMPDFFISLLMLCCETELSYSYKRGMTEPVCCRVGFIADVANLLYDFTGIPFRYNRRGDPLVKVVKECLDGIGKPIDDTAIRDNIINHITIEATKTLPESAGEEDLLSHYISLDQAEISTVTFDDETLSQISASNGNLPDEYEYLSAHAQCYPRHLVGKAKKGWRRSRPVTDLTNSRLHGEPEDLIHSGLKPWMNDFVLRSLDIRNTRTKRLAELFQEKCRDKLPKRIHRDDEFCNWLIAAFENDSHVPDSYYGDDILQMICNGLQMVLKKNTDSENEKTVHYKYEHGEPETIILPCNPRNIIRVEPSLSYPRPFLAFRNGRITRAI
jgi:hypothetical protein